MTFAATSNRYPGVGGVPTETRQMKINTAVDIKQGDALYYTSNAATPITAAADGATFCGIALGNVNTGKLPAGASGDLTISTMPVLRKGVVEMKCTASETYTHGLAVQIGTVDCQGIVLGNTYQIGTVYLPDGSSVSGGAGKTVAVLIETSIPAAATTVY